MQKKPKVLLSFQNRLAFGIFYITLNKDHKKYANDYHQ